MRVSGQVIWATGVQGLRDLTADLGRPVGDGVKGQAISLRFDARAALTERQRECVLWSARGKTAGETAGILGISEETVVRHLKIARERYSVPCRQMLILCALFDGIIGFSDVYDWWRPL